MDVRIGVTNAPREVSLELAETTDPAVLRTEIDRALGTEGAVLWLTDRKGRQVAVPVAKIAYVEIGASDAEKRIGFGGWNAVGVTGLLARQLLVVTGKGGVGKTTVAAGLALLAARQGRRTLVCEVDAKGSLAGAFDVGPLAFAPRTVSPGLWAMTMNTEDSLREYLALQLRVPLLARIGPLARTFDFVASAAPGVREILTIGKLCYEVRERNYDLVVVDAVASGHVIAQLSAASTIEHLVQVGLVREQTRWMREILEDPTRTGVVIVSTGEEMPVAESVELAGRLQAETGTHLAAVVANRVLPEPFAKPDEALFAKVTTVKGRKALAGVVGAGAGAVLDAAALSSSLRRRQAVHLDHLRSALGAVVPVLLLPERFDRTEGLGATQQVADALGEELE